jgi:hypothetical protein
MGTGGKAHKQMVKEIRKMFELKGYSCKEEKLIHSCSGMRTHIDLFCQRNNEIVIIECGMVDLWNLCEKHKTYPKAMVFQYPYITRFLGRKSYPKMHLTEEEKHPIPFSRMGKSLAKQKR